MEWLDDHAEFEERWYAVPSEHRPQSDLPHAGVDVGQVFL